MKQVLIVIPARYASTRLPGKPLQKIAGVEMIRRVAQNARIVCDTTHDYATDYVVATDHEQILGFCEQYQIPAIMTDDTCRSGTERCYSAVKKLRRKPDLIVNLQGDNPLCPPEILRSLPDTWNEDVIAGHSAELYTPCVRLSWEAHDRLVESKKVTPYTGTTVLVDRNGMAMAFSKSILPVIRDPDAARKRMSVSPVRQHIGLYAYRYDTLEHYFTLPVSDYEQNDLEGLEQMRFLYNGWKIRMVEVEFHGRPFTGGIDSPEDVARAEEILRKYGDPMAIV
ncbi:MAG: 3-deoxy-manno-octulosonate cytidylyltransferase [Planctomycetia bacterium]|nr:3-deoxy-manno-octulosonate cytidylyltransferase [Planctomycetia bacterium]